MSKLRQELDAAFSNARLRPTTQRYAVLEFLVRHPVHATAEDIFHAVNRGDPRASRATIYNSLHSLARAGLVREVVSEGKAARFDASLHRHHHFLCEQCGAVEDIAWFDLPAPAVKAPLAGRSVRNFEILFRGTCESCGGGNPKSGEQS
ncbi:MAG TPA: Fur family transcriptional regulator [Candidatus Sulfopaludibacter sp.]|nr:Fur family transcriptional regulator [Candidatus Sulfopaludibacter sp.]